MPEAATIAEPSTATPSPAPASGAVTNDAPKTTPGFLDHIAIKQAPKVPDSKPQSSGEPAKEGTPKTEPTQIPAKLLAGRFKTSEELEKAYDESSREGLRLYQESRDWNKKLAERESKIAELEDAIKLKEVAPTFKELSAEAEKELRKDDPAAYAEYIADKKLYQRDLQATKEKLKAEREAREYRSTKTQEFIQKRGLELASDKEKYPDFEALLPDMEYLKDRLGEDIKGKDWSVDFLYLASLGRRYLQAHRSGKTASEDATRRAAETARATAAATQPGGASPPNVPSKVDPDSDQAFMERILKAGNRNLF